MQAALLRKVEELTLYTLEQQELIEGLLAQNERQQRQLDETVTENGSTEKIHYLTSATGLFAIFVKSSSSEIMNYVLKDHQGSLAATVHGHTVERLSYDAWGRRRNTTDFGYRNVSHTFDRGYTLHEHYDGFDLINMNGRLYDPIFGRMLSPDVVVQDNWSSQAYNRYSYCFNNPLRFTDPSGYVVRGSRNYYNWSSNVYYDFGNYRSNGSAFNTDLSEGKISPIYDVNGHFLGTDDEGLQGDAIVMRREDFRQGMSHEDALSKATYINSFDALLRIYSHYNNLNNRPDWDGFITISEGIRWAKTHPNALTYYNPDNALYMNASKLNFGNLSVKNIGLEEGETGNVNLLDYVRLFSSSSRSTTYALGNTQIQLLDSSNGSVKLFSDDYDWNYHNAFVHGHPQGRRDWLIYLERQRADLNNTHGFPIYIYGTGQIRLK